MAMYNTPVLGFTGTTNGDRPMVNTVTLLFPDGTAKTIDREFTTYKITDGKFWMSWHGCYFWDSNSDPNSPDYLAEDDLENLRAATLIETDIEEDADADYTFVIENFDVTY